MRKSAMSAYRLHYFPESGNSYKLALMLTLCGQTFEPVWTDFGGGATRTPEWRRNVNEMGEIPVLEENGMRLTQTAPILLKLAEQYGRFGGERAAEQYEVLRCYSGTITSSSVTWRAIDITARSRRLPTPCAGSLPQAP
jgi:glutathione S-transferase